MILKYFAFKHALILLVLYLDWFVPWRITLTHPSIHLNEKRGGKRICQNDVCMHWVPVGKQEPPHAVFSFWPLSSSSSGELPVPLCPCPVPCFPFRHTSLSLSLSHMLSSEFRPLNRPAVHKEIHSRTGGSTRMKFTYLVMRTCWRDKNWSIAY